MAGVTLKMPAEYWNFVFALLIVSVSTLGAEVFTPTAASKVSRMRLDSPGPMGIRVLEPPPTKPDAPSTSTRSGNDDGTHVTLTGPSPVASKPRACVTVSKDGRVLNGKLTAQPDNSPNPTIPTNTLQHFFM